MKKVISKNSDTIVSIENLTGKELICYQSRGGHICALQSISSEKKGGLTKKEYAFCNLGYSTSPPVFAAQGWFGPIHLALDAGRILFAFEDYNDLIMAIKQGKI